MDCYLKGIFMKVKSLSRFALPFLLLSPFQLALADHPDYSDNFLLGDWGETRTNMADKGYEFEFIFTSDIYNLNYDAGTGKNVSKNIDLNNTDITLTIDGEKAFGLNGATFFAYILADSGIDPSGEYIGDAQTFSNIESPNFVHLHELWYQQSFAEEKASVLFGLYDLNSEFDVIETGGLFSSSSHGIGPDFSQSGQNGPSIFPAVSLSLRGLYNITDQVYIQAVILDAVPGDGNTDSNENRAVIKLDSTDGYLTVAEFGHVSRDDESYHKYSIGFWGYTKAKKEDIDAGNNIKNKGVYMAADANIFQEAEDSTQGLNGFIRYGFAEDKINKFKTYNGAGLAYTGLIPGRDEDQLGLAIAIVNPTDSFKTGNPGVAAPETAIELNYFTQITPWLALKPDIQWIKNPGMLNNKSQATVIGMRIELSL